MEGSVWLDWGKTQIKPARNQDGSRDASQPNHPPARRYTVDSSPMSAHHIIL